ncbi:DUF2194 domain-containing protein [Salimicrobium sp. PL1-032A]|uniref:DUF2194 domain-containing protein n=1 Tax=Salimicrobium sp. PL1-032A TaxID=3095364 RepID=UPI00325FE94B
MKKYIIRWSVFLFLLLIGLVVLLQLVRLDVLHQWFPVTSPQVEKASTMTASESVEGGTRMTVYLHENDSELSKGSINNIEQALDYAKVPNERIDRDGITTLEPSPYSVLVLAGEHSEQWPKEAIASFVEEGGRVMIAGRFVDESWDDLLGIKENNGFKDEVTGITFEQELFPGYVDLDESSYLLTHSIADVELEEDVEVPLRVEEEPLMWINEAGEGKIMFWNSTVVTDKSVRGLLLHSLSLLPPSFVSSQAAIKVMHIDDFPAPIPFSTTEEIDREYGMSIKEFYTDVWWEDMKDLKEDYDFEYTGYMIGTYRDDTELRGEGLLKTARYPMLYFGRSLLNGGGEIGMHGYNHQSLVTEEEPIDPELGYRPWENQGTMEEAVVEAKELFHYYFPEETLNAYVPPSNVLNRTGISALHETLPELRTISSLYIGGDKGSLEQEFGMDEEYDGLYHFPRITSGYSESPEDQFLQTDTIANVGVFAHFIHPDDVLDSYRAKGRTWEDMYNNLQEMGEHVNENFPHLETMTQSNATEKMIQYEESDISVSYEENSILITGNAILSPSHLFIRVEQGKSIEEGSHPFGTVELYSEGLYKITMQQPRADIPLKGGGE